MIAFKKLIMLIALIFFSNAVRSSATNFSYLKIDKNNIQHIKEYEKVHRKFFKKLCTPGSEHRFNRLWKKFRGDGYYVPIIGDKLDKDTIRKYIPDLKRKIRWISLHKKNLKSMKKDFIFLKKIVVDLKILLKIILKEKKLYYEIQDKTMKRNARNRGINFYSNFKIKFRKLLTMVPFLLGYHFPVDHLTLRKDYDFFSNKIGKKARKKANDIYFFRKIVEDGSANLDQTGSDLFFRATLNTVYLNMKNQVDFMSEDLRFDFNYLLKKIEEYLSWGNKKFLKRFSEWEKRTERAYGFYKRILNNNYIMDGKKLETRDLIFKKSKAKFRLENYINSKYVDVYQFWEKKSELMRALFSLETILYNEVGRIDNDGAYERKDILQVVLNRVNLSEFALLETDEVLYKNLFMLLEKKVEKYKWLNTLFKEGEFSFTYFFMHGSVRVFCPSMTRTSRALRKTNLNLSLNALRSPRNKFKGLRYFSRAAMLGRIDMSILWTDYFPIHESPGGRIKNDKKLLKRYKNDEYEFLYRFKDEFSNEYNVVNIKEKKYVMPVSKILFYKYRSPHNFKYFRKKQ